MTALGRFFDFVLDALAALAGALLVALMLATVVKVGMRLVLNHGVLGIDQISGTLMVYITFLGAAWVLRREGHVTVEILAAILPERAQRAIGVLGSIVGAAACLAVTWFSAKTVLLSIERGVMVAAEIEIPRAVNLIVIPLGCLLLGIEFLRRALRIYRGTRLAGALQRLED